MEDIETKYLDNSFILLGRTGYGKSTTCKALTGNTNIVISSSHNSCTSQVSYYPGTFKHILGNKFFTMIDTPGLDDSDGRDTEIYQNLRNMLQTRDLKVKGLFILFSLQSDRFGESEKNIIEKIINLVPIKDLWKYITIIVTHSYYNKPEKLEKKKNEFKEDLKNLLERKYIPEAFSKYGVIGYFKDINIVFTDFDDENPSIEEAKEIKAIMENSFNKEPLFQYILEEVRNDILALEYNDDEKKKAMLYRCKIRFIKYIGQNGKLLNEVRSILEKHFEKEIEKSELKTEHAFIAGGVAGGIGLIALAGLAFPPLEIAAIVGFIGSISASAISNVVGLTEFGINKSKNEVFKNEEIKSFVDETK